MVSFTLCIFHYNTKIWEGNLKIKQKKFFWFPYFLPYLHQESSSFAYTDWYMSKRWKESCAAPQLDKGKIAYGNDQTLN